MDFDLSPLWISLKTAVVATGLAFIGGIGAARGMLVYRGRWQGVLDGLLTMPLILPPTVVGFVLLLLLGSNSPLGQLLEAMGITIIFSWAATVIASTVVAFPLMYKTVLGAFRQVNPDLLDCSRTLGASERRVFWELLLPLAWPGVVAGTILAFARALGEFGATLMVAGSIPGRTQTMPIAIFFAGEAGHLKEAFFWTVVLGSIALSAIVLINCVSEEPLAKQRLTDRPFIKQIAATLQQGFTILSKGANRQGDESFHTSDASDFAHSLAKAAKDKSTSHDRIPEARVNEQDTGLVVELEKTLSQLTLATQFTVGDRPLAILGASGAGKSTILRCIAGLITPTQGRIVLNGRVLFDTEQGINIPSAQRHVGFLFQNYALFPHMRVARNIGFGLQHLPPQERHDRIAYYLALLQLDGLADQYPHQLSGGQQQRVALARVLATDPDVLLLDEPLSALDSYLRDRVEQSLMNLFSTYQGSVLLVTHNLEQAYRLCDRWLVIADGTTIANGPKQEIFERPPNTLTAQLTECRNLSAAEAVGEDRVRALDWNHCLLTVTEPLPPSPFFVGIRAHHLSILSEQNGENCVPCWPVFMSETHHRVIVYLHVGDRPPHEFGPHASYHLQAELPKEEGLQILPLSENGPEYKTNPSPLWVQLDTLRLIVISA